MFSIKPFHLGVGLLVLFLWARPTHAFGAGNIASISKVEGQNCECGVCEVSGPPGHALIVAES